MKKQEKKWFLIWLPQDLHLISKQITSTRGITRTKLFEDLFIRYLKSDVKDDLNKKLNDIKGLQKVDFANVTS